MRIRLTHIDGSYPNLALMKLSHWHKSKGDTVYFTRSVNKDLFELNYDLVYGSSVFRFSDTKIKQFKEQWPGALIGGTGTESNITVEDVIGQPHDQYDYGIYPQFKWSIGFTSRGCRMACPFCVVGPREGKIHSTSTIKDIYRKNDMKNILLLDNDFFGQPEWEMRCRELIKGKFKICLDQGINVRLITNEQAVMLSRLLYYDDQFKTRRIYIAWDNLKDEDRFFSGVDKLLKTTIKKHHLMVYMLVGYDKDETMDSILYRFNRIKDAGMMPYPMLYNLEDKQLRRFQRWVVRRYYEFVPWGDYQKVTNIGQKLL